jgi:hypothetical protein
MQECLEPVMGSRVSTSHWRSRCTGQVHKVIVLSDCGSMQSLD